MIHAKSFGLLVNPEEARESEKVDFQVKIK
jgi:hypothetical protein